VASTVPHSPTASRFSRSSAVPQGAALAEALLHAERGLAATHLGGALPSASASPSVGDSGSPAMPVTRTPPSEGGGAEARDGSDMGSARGVLTRQSSGGSSETSETSPELRGSATKA